MSESEAARLAYYNHLREVIGAENAETIMSTLPVQPVSQLATRSDVDRLETRVDRLESEMRAEFSAIHKAMRDQYRNYSILTVGSLTALTAIFSLIVGLIT